MIFLAAYFGELLLLFLLARALSMRLSLLLYRLGMGETMVMHLLAVLFLMGTFIHEMAHYLFAVILRVRVFSMTLIPRPSSKGYIKMGGIEHAQCDLFRNLLIGSAPFVIGNIILFFLISFLISHNPSINNWLSWVIGFIVFQIGNTMFSSKKDMEGTLEILGILGVVLILAYLFGWRISLEQLDQSIPNSLVSIIRQGDLFLGIPIILDILVIGVTMTFGRGDKN